MIRDELPIQKRLKELAWESDGIRISMEANQKVIDKFIEEFENRKKLVALIRTHPGREELTKNAYQSANNEDCNCIVYSGEKVNDYSYNLYCNELKDMVSDGYFFFLDSDDVVIPGAIQKIIPYLNENKALIVQMLRNGRPKPRNGLIERGKIGLPCMILHSKHKHLADVPATEDGDFQWIKAVTDKIGYEFVPIPVVDAGERRRGK